MKCICNHIKFVTLFCLKRILILAVVFFLKKSHFKILVNIFPKILQFKKINIFGLKYWLIHTVVTAISGVITHGLHHTCANIQSFILKVTKFIIEIHFTYRKFKNETLRALCTNSLTPQLPQEFCNPLDHWLESIRPTNHPSDYKIRGLTHELKIW